MTTKPNWDQKFYEDSNRVLLAESDMLENRLLASGQTAPARPAACSSQDLIAANDALSVHVAKLKALVSGATTPQVTSHPTAKPASKSLTQKVCEARGCKDLAELKERYLAGEFRDSLD